MPNILPGPWHLEFDTQGRRGERVMGHTPGPWRPYFYVGNRRLRTGQWGLIGGDGLPLFCNGVKENCGNSEADIRLAAAAPELLAACRLLLYAGTDGYACYCVDTPGEKCWHCVAAAAIDKAEGRSE